jgi:hypothetical protein
MVDIGEPHDAIAVLKYCLAVGNSRWCMPEILRTQAEAQRALGLEQEAIASLKESLRVAATVEGVAWKLRSALSLAGLLRDQGDTSGARRVLEPVYAQVVNKFDAGDVRAAREFLTALT